MPSKLPIAQLHLPLLEAAPIAFSAEQQQELTQALIELLLHAAALCDAEGAKYENRTER